MSIINIVGAKIWGGGEQYVYDICKQLQQRHRAAYTLVDQSNEEMQSRYAQVGHVMTATLYTLKGFLSVNAVAKQMKAQGLNTPIIKNTSKYYIVYNGIDPNRFLSFADNVPMKSKVTTFGYSARITERKGLYLILSALEQIHQKNPDIRLIISGAGTEDQIKKLKDYIDAHHMHSYVEFIGFTPDIEGLYRSIDCLLLPTVTREAFGLVICEAMYCGVPVITSGSGAQREIIEDGISGFIVDPLNEHTLQQAVEHVMSDAVDLSSIITNARRVVEERFIINRVADELVAIIDNLHSTNH